MGSPDYCGLHHPQLRAGPAWWPTLPESDLRPRGEIADLFLVIEPRALHTVPPGYCTVHDSVWEAEVSVGLAEYQSPVVRILDVLDRSHEQVAGFARASRTTVEQVRAILVAVEPEPLLI